MTTKADQLWKSIEDDEIRREFNVDVDTGLAFQIRLLREKNGWTQEQLAERAGSKQETICQWENPNYGRYTLTTLKSLATAFDVGLMVKFAPFSEVIEWNANLTPERLAPPSFAEERQARQVRASLVHPTMLLGSTVTVVTQGTLSWDAYSAQVMASLPGTVECIIQPTLFKEQGAYAHRQTQSKKEPDYDLAA
jgi:HTH-type transcriptional regulator/antitoxin HipB